ncbi:MAG: alpha/beta hydrolase-fold protein [Lysobacterales bacterium]
MPPCLRLALAAAAALVSCPAPALDASPWTAEPAPFAIERSAVHPLTSAQGRHYALYVKLPPGYERAENLLRRYPVVYLTDGPYTFQVASGVTRVPFSQELFEEFILVGLSWAEGEAPADSRRRDLTPTIAADKPGSGGAADYLAFLRDVAVPWVEREYRADPARRTLAGQSYGGLFGLWVALTEPTLFRNYVLSSASLWYDHRTLFALERGVAAQRRDLAANLYFVIGSRERPGQCGHADCEVDMVADQAAMVRALQSRGYPHLRVQAKVVPGAYHETTFPVGLLWALQELFTRRR